MLGADVHALSACVLRGFTYVIALPHMLYYKLFVTELIAWRIHK